MYLHYEMMNKREDDDDENDDAMVNTKSRPIPEVREKSRKNESTKAERCG
jgi:hypothetical protein